MSWNDLRKGRYSQPNGEYFITFVTFNRLSLFDNSQAACAFCRVIAINEACTDAQWLAWVLMPDHFHGLLRLGGKCSLGRVINDLKGRGARAVHAGIGSAGACWQKAYFDRALRREDDRLGIARYIVANPLRAGLVRSLGDYPYWNAVYL